MNFANSLFQWTGGNLLYNSGNWTNLGTITATGTTTKGISGTFNSGTIVLTNSAVLQIGDYGRPTLSGGLNNLASGVVDIQSDATMPSGGAAITNWGLLRKSGGTGTSVISADFCSQNGTVEVDSGTLLLAGGGTSSNGTFNINAGATLNLSGNGNARYTGSFSGSGSGMVLLSSGTLNAALPGANLNFPGKQFQWTGGWIAYWQAGFTNLGTITAAGTNEKTFYGTFNNAGTLAVTNSGDIYQWSGMLNNLAGGTVDFQSDAPINGAGVSINNWGLIRKSGGTGTSVISLAFNNQNGNIEVDSGTLRLANGTYSQGSGVLTMALGGRGAGQAGQLSVSTTAALGGSLNVFLTNGFALATGDRFQILACGTRSGTFSTANLPAGTSLDYTSTGVSLVVTGALPVLVTSPTLSGSNFTLGFSTIGGQSYTIERNDNLGTTNWVFQTNFLGNGSLIQVVVPVTNATQRFFRVREP